MEEQWKEQIKTLTKLRDEADGKLKSALALHFPRPFGYPSATKSRSKKLEELTIARALSTYVRSDFAIKKLQENLNEAKKSV